MYSEWVSFGLEATNYLCGTCVKTAWNNSKEYDKIVTWRSRSSFLHYDVIIPNAKFKPIITLLIR